MFSKVDMLLLVFFLCRIAWRIYLLIQRIASRDYLGAFLETIAVGREVCLNSDLLHRFGVEVARRSKKSVIVFCHYLRRFLNEEDGQD